MSLAQNLLALTQAIGADIKALRAEASATPWTLASFYTPNNFAQWTGPDKAQWRQVGNRIEIRGAGRQTISGSNFGNGILVGMPQAPQTQLVGWAQWQTGGFAALVIYAGDTEIVADSIGSRGTFGVGWIRFSNGAGYNLTP